MTVTLQTTIGLGRLVDLVIRDAQGQRLRVTPTGEQWLAWKPDTRDLVVLHPGTGEGVVAKQRDARRHQQFHGAVPERTRMMEWPTSRGEMRVLGLIESVTYVANGFRSPSKGLHHWIHQFGDRGEQGHGAEHVQAPSTHGEEFMPRLDVDTTGQLLVVRRAGNRFSVRDWIIG